MKNDSTFLTYQKIPHSELVSIFEEIEEKQELGIKNAEVLNRTSLTSHN
jgi:hypothetical protein